jgi:hypothetical protein
LGAGVQTLTEIVVGTIETPLLTAALGAISSIAAISFDVWISQYDPGQPKTATFRIRRTNVTGTILYSTFLNAASDTTAGNENRFVGNFVDSSPTDGNYYFSIQETAGTSSTQIWSLSYNVIAWGK